MLELAVQQKVIDFFGDLEENGVDRQDICNFVNTWGNGELPGSDDALDVLERSKADRLAGRIVPIEELFADMERIVGGQESFKLYALRGGYGQRV